MWKILKLCYQVCKIYSLIVVVLGCSVSNDRKVNQASWTAENWSATVKYVQNKIQIPRKPAGPLKYTLYYNIHFAK